MRLQHQIGTDKVVLTGNGFFPIHRNFLLAVIIINYSEFTLRLKRFFFYFRWLELFLLIKLLYSKMN